MILRHHVIAAVQLLKLAAKTPAHKKGLVSCDEVRAKLVQAGHKNVVEKEVATLLTQEYGAPVNGRYSSPFNS